MKRLMVVGLACFFLSLSVAVRIRRRHLSPLPPRQQLQLPCRRQLKKTTRVPSPICARSPFEGARAGEGYSCSRDGKQMIFQSEREAGNPFYQMYVMNLESGATHRVSPGHGKTTCGWIHPDGKQVLFASTHEDPDWKKKADAEYAERQHPKQRLLVEF